MIVVNKRYYDYDYDNNTIIMFDAEDVGLTLDFDVPHQQNSQSNINGVTSTSQLQSQSTETVPDDIIDPKQTVTTPTLGSGGNNLDDIKEKEEATNNNEKKDDDDEKEAIAKDDKNMGNISWISSSSPKGLRRIPYALQVAHSYTINKLEVQLTTLVDTRTILKQKQERAKAKALALAQQEAIKQQQQQHAEYMASRHHQHGGHRQYPSYGTHSPHAHPSHHQHAPRPGYVPPPPHPHRPGYPHPNPHPRHYAQQRAAHPHPHPGYPPHAYHANGQRKQEAPTSPSGRGYYGASGQHRQNPQKYMSYNTNTNHAVQQQNKSK